MAQACCTTTMLDFVGPGGERITPSQLPPPGLKRWSLRQRALVVAAVRHGMLTFCEACERYDLSLDEFLAWQGRSMRFGPSGETETDCNRQASLLLFF